MKPFEVQVSQKALDQITEAFLFIADDSPENAFKWEARIIKLIQDLSFLPGYALDEAATERLGYPVHKYVFERNYLIHFRIEHSRRIVQVINFRHVARLPARGEP